VKNTLINKFINQTEGSIAIMAAVVSVALIGAAGVGVDTYIAQSSDTALRHIVDLTCDRIENADIASFPTAITANKMASKYAENLKLNTAAPDATITITDPAKPNDLSDTVTVSATGTFTPTFTSVLGAEPYKMTKNATCKRREKLKPGVDPKCNVIITDLNITIKKKITMASLSQYAAIDDVGDGTQAYLYTIIGRDKVIVKREMFSKDLTLDPSSLINGGKDKVMYIQVMNKDGSIPTLQEQCVIDFPPTPPIPPITPFEDPGPPIPPVPPTTSPKCTSISGRIAEDGDETMWATDMALGLPGEREANGVDGKISNLTSFNISPSFESVRQGSTGGITISKLGIGSLFVPLTSNFTKTEKTSSVSDAETILGISIESSYIIGLFASPDTMGSRLYNRNAAELAGMGYKLDHIYSTATAVWQHPTDFSCIRTISPIVIDLTNKGTIETTGISTAQNAARSSVGKTISFDMLGAGIPQKMEWIAGNGQGFLVDNLDGNAAKDMNGKRLFGNDVKHANGYAKLASTFVPDKDGNLTGDSLKGLSVWVDNGDGLVQSDELKSLDELGITSINTRVEAVKDDKGDMLMRSYVIRNNKRVMSEDVWFGVAK
jgi:hypothetical protein